jgi:ribosomal protein L22
MADRKGGKSSPGDVGTKVDQPSEQAGAEKAEVEAAEAAQAAGTEKAAEKAKPKPRPRKRRTPVEGEAEGTAAEETGVEKAAAGRVANVDATAEAKAEAKPARKRGARGGAGRARKAEEPKAEEPPKEAPKPRRAPASTNGARPVVRAQARYVRTSARKARLVCDHIRGKSVDEARAILAYTPRAVARDWAKLLESAVANAEHNHELVGDDLRVLAAFADEGPTLKRFRPRAMGRATRIRKRTSHLTITLTPKES